MFGRIPPFYSPGSWPGGTVPNPTSFDAAVTFKETVTFNKTAQASTAETIATFKVSDDATSKIEIANSSTTDTAFVPMITAVQAGASLAFRQVAQGTTDSGSAPLHYVESRIGAGTAVTTRPLWAMYNASNQVLSFLPLNSGANLAMSWGTQTGGSPAFTTRSTGTRAVWRSAIDGSNVDYATGVDSTSAILWDSVPQATSSFFFVRYGGTTALDELRGDGRYKTTGARVKKLRVATTSPVTVNAGTDEIITSKLSVAGAVTINLPASPSTGLSFTIQDGTGDAGSNNITITPAAGNINGAASLVISTNYGARDLVYDGTQWLAR